MIQPTAIRRAALALAPMAAAVMNPARLAAQSPTSPDAPAVVPIAGQVARGAGALPHDLSPWSMFMNADVVVKAILVGLALASLVTWTVWLAKSIELALARRRLSAAVRGLGRARTLDEAAATVAASGSPAALLARAALQEIERSGADLDKAGIVERVALVVQRIEAHEGRRMMRGTGVLATIGSTGPFVGLFGTVWGIMNSFVGIAKSQTTNLAVVAPGIAEALLATAVGLAAAIPAVVIYNVFARSIAGYRALMADAVAEVMRLLSRDLDLRAAQLAAASPRHTLRIAE